MSRFNRRRLSVEEMRDALLAIDGSIDLTVRGTLQSGLGTDAEKTTTKRLSMNPEQLNRRTVYLPLQGITEPVESLRFWGLRQQLPGKQIDQCYFAGSILDEQRFVTERSNNFVKALLADKNVNDRSKLKPRIAELPIARPCLKGGLISFELHYRLQAANFR
ncbi:MAG: hypothetical protein IPL01_24745 [Acidobacteria bacterium]|nr:hypothetical protein [Acidobacteriota bacterium]